MSHYENIYDFDTPDSPNNLKWEFINPHGPNGLVTDGSFPGGCWNWADRKTKSPKVGPKKPFTGAGYIYTEASTPTTKGDQFVMTTKDPVDGSGRNIELSLRYSADTNDNDCQLIIEVFTNGEWHKEFDQNVGSRNSDWKEILLNLSHYTGTDILFKITIDMLTDKNVWNNDIGIDNIRITGGTLVTDNIIDFLAARNIHKLNDHTQTFNGKGKTSFELETVVKDLKSGKMDYSKYPNGVLIVESLTKVHLIKEES